MLKIKTIYDNLSLIKQKKGRKNMSKEKIVAKNVNKNGVCSYYEKIENQKGITLIALIITIIVMLILVGVTVTISLNGGLFNIAQKAKTDTETKKAEELEIVNERIKIGDTWYDSIEAYEKKIPSENQGEPTEEPVNLNPSGTIPKGATYKKSDDTILNEGDAFPQTLTNGEIYTYGDYQYQYFKRTVQINQIMTTTVTGWSVNVIDKTKTSYGIILESIANTRVTEMASTFSGCENLVSAPKIPSTITTLSSAFYGCKNLIVAPEIPNSVTNMGSTFRNCSSLKTAPVIPENVNSLWYTFANCTSLTGIVTINVTASLSKNAAMSENSSYGCFDGVDFKTQNITLTGTCSDSVLDYSIGESAGVGNYCRICNGTCAYGQVNGH